MPNIYNVVELFIGHHPSFPRLPWLSYVASQPSRIWFRRFNISLRGFPKQDGSRTEVEVDEVFGLYIVSCVTVCSVVADRE